MQDLSSPTTLTDALFGTPDVTSAMNDDAHLAGIVRFEIALAQAEAAAGVITAAHAEAIVKALSGYELPTGPDRTGLFTDAQKAGTIVVPFVKRLTAAVRDAAPDAAAFVHFGATSQDAIDTSHMLQIRAATTAILVELRRLARAARALADTHRDTVVLGRTLLQPATPITFGLKAAGWLVGAVDSFERVAATAGSGLALQFGGAAGNLGSLGEKGPAVAAALARNLGLPLPTPALPWHTRRGPTAALGAALGILCGHAGKIARDVSLLMQYELGEVAEPSGEGRGGSSAMPHKRNPVRCMITLANATRAPGLVATLLTGLVEEHERALGGWQAEWAIWPQLLGCAAGSTKAMADTLEGLSVDTARMRENFDALRGLPMTEAVSLALAPALGRDAAHRAVELAARQATTGDRNLAEALAANSDVASILGAAELSRLTRPETARGANDAFIEAALAHADAVLGASTPFTGSQGV